MSHVLQKRYGSVRNFVLEAMRIEDRIRALKVGKSCTIKRLPHYEISCSS